MIDIDLTIPEFLVQPFWTESKHSVISAARRTGKTMNAVRWQLDNLLREKDKTGLWIDTVQGNIDKYMERYFMPTLKPIWSLCHWDKQKNILKLPNGSYLDFGSAQLPENLEGFEYDFVVLNEAGIILKKPALWRNTIQPMTKKETCKVRFIGTPKGKNLFFELFQNAVQGNESWKSYKFSVYNSPFWTSKEIELVKDQVPEAVWLQEFMGEFLDEGAGVFRRVSECVNNSIELISKGLENHKYILGIDLAKYHDFTVITGIDIATKQIVYFDRFNKLDWGFQQEKILEVHRNFNNAYVVIDATGIGDPIYDNLSKTLHSKIIPFKINNASKKELIEGLSIAIESKKISYPHIEEMISELQSYEFDISKFGNVRYSAPEGLYDDCVISLCLAYYGSKTRGGEVISVQYDKAKHYNYGVESGSTTFEEIDKMIKGSLGRR